MGRGRAKAKQAKVARQLKYQSSGISIEDLREELGADNSPSAHDDGDTEDRYHDPYDDGDDDDPYAEVIDGYAGDRSEG